jgi:GH24 family phage-related lysozyme (muramidase)
MKDLWPGNNGLKRRRDEEAALFESGFLPAGD